MAKTLWQVRRDGDYWETGKEVRAVIAEHAAETFVDIHVDTDDGDTITVFVRPKGSLIQGHAFDVVVKIGEKTYSTQETTFKGHDAYAIDDEYAVK